MLLAAREKPRAEPELSEKKQSDRIQLHKESPPTQQVQQPTEVIVDDSGVTPAYSNFCRVTATPEEVIVDCGLNTQPFAEGRQEVKANHRIIMSFYTTKRLLTALGMTVQRHEQTFGAIELDVRRRVSTPQPRVPQAAAPRKVEEQPVLKLDR
jgi:hypothetical protein